MTDTIPERRQTAEHELAPLTPGQVLWCYAKKWGFVFVLIVTGGAAWQIVRGCVATGAGVIGLQTTEAAAAQQGMNDVTHEELQTAVGEIKIEARKTTDNTNKIVKGMPAPWKKRAGIQ